MADGGMYDHIGGGFHRYSTDKRWLVPHFEKMLYDNALLTLAYLDGYQATGTEQFARVARETLDYVLREMTSPEGGFYSATDADSVTPKGEREEGYYFTWTPEELAAILSEPELRLIKEYYGVRPDGDFEGRNILHTPRSAEEVARGLGLEQDQFFDGLKEVKLKLLAARSQRPPPLRDDKIQASWNGLMIAAFARGGRVLAEPRYVRAAEKAAQHIQSALSPGGKLRHSLTHGRASAHAFLDDHAFLATGLIELFQATGRGEHLKAATALLGELSARFADPKAGGYFLTPQDHEALLARDKPDRDGAIPSGNSHVLMAELALYQLTSNDAWRKRAESTLRAFSARLMQNPAALDEMMLAVDFELGAPKQIALVVPPEDPEGAQALKAVLATTFTPNSVLVVSEVGDGPSALEALIPWIAGKVPKKERATAYVCEQGACELPTTDPKVLLRQVSRVKK
jgi:uncharacterized protein YyaL (SSP411 family)